jgi:hypothetical protein
VYKCNPAGHCLKLIRDPAIFAAERHAYEQLHPSARRLFIPIHFFCEVRVGGHEWRGYYMKQVLAPCP